MRYATSNAEDPANDIPGEIPSPQASAFIIQESSARERRHQQQKKDVPRGALLSCVHVWFMVILRAVLSLAYVLAFFVAGLVVGGSFWWTRRSGRARAVGVICGACTMRGVLPRLAAWFGGLRRHASRTGGVGGGVRLRRAQSARPLGSRLAFRSCGRQVETAWSCAVPRR